MGRISHPDAPPPAMEHADAALSPVPLGSPIALMRDVIKTIDTEFTVRDVTELVKKKFPGAATNENSISGGMHKLRKRQEIVQVKPGVGKQPAVYCRPGKQRPAENAQGEQQLRLAQ